MQTAIIVPVFNALEVVQSTLRRLVETIPPSVGIVLVDDASAQPTQRFLQDFAATLRAPSALIRHPRQQLFTRAVNDGFRHAYHSWHPEFMVALNSDVELREGWLEGLLDGMKDPKVGIVGYPDNPDENPHGKEYVEKKMPEYVTGHAIMFRTMMLEKIGILRETDLDGREDPALRHLKGQAHIGSERLLGYRANIRGWRSIECWLPRLHHAAGGSWGLDLNWLANFDLKPLWEPCDTLDHPKSI